MMNRMRLFFSAVLLAVTVQASAASDVAIETYGDAPWFEQTAVTYDGTPAWQIGDLAALGSDEYVESVLTITVQGPCTLSFQYGAQGMSGSCSCYLDGEYVSLQRNWSSALTWTLNTITISEAGEQTVEISDSYCSQWYSSSYTPSKFWIADVQRIAAPDGVTVSFDTNGGYCTTSSQYYESGAEYGELPTPYRSQGEFLGWYTSAIGGEKVEECDYVKFDVTQLYAHWGMSIEEALGVGEDVTVEVEQDWQTEDPDWYGTVDLSYDGEGCAVAGFDDGSSKRFYVTVNGAGTLSFAVRCVNSTVDVSVRQQTGEYSYRNESLAYLYSSYSYGGAQTYSVNGFKVTKYYTGGWVRFDIEAYGAGEHVFDFYGYGDSSDGGDSYALVDCMSWTPATGSAVVQFEYEDGKFSSARAYSPGETYGSLPSPSRTGYVFAGWCTDEDLLNAVDADDYVPFSGAHLYAKWKKTLALDNENWYESEETYTTGDVVYRTDVVTNGCVETENWGTVYTYAPSYIEFTVNGKGFFSFWLNLAGSVQYVISVDGEQVGRTGYNYDYSYLFGSDEQTLSNWKKQCLTISGTGRHTVRLTVTGTGYTDGGVALVKDNAFETYGNQSTFGEWTDKVKNYGCWITGNLPALQAKYAKDTTPKGRVLHAITTLLTLGENTSFQSLFKGFGYAINYMDLNGSWGDPDFSKAPTGNKIVDTLITVGEPLVKTALEDLEAIPSSMKEFDLSAEDCAYFDEDVKIDYGDILYMRAALKGMLGFAYWSKAYNVEIDYDQMQKDGCGVALQTVSGEASLKTEAAWDKIDWLAPCDGDSYNGRSPFKAVKSGSSIYVFAPHEEGETLSSCYISFANLATGKSYSGSYYSYGDSSYYPESTVTLAANFDEGSVFCLNLSQFSGVKIANVYLKSVSCYIMTDGWVSSSYWSSKSVLKERYILHQTKVMDKVRNAAALATAKNYVKEGLQLWKQADAKVVARTCDCLHLIEYDHSNEVKTRQIAAWRENFPRALQSLKDGSVQEYDWMNCLCRKNYKACVDTLADPLAVNVNKLFTGDITRSVLPESLSSDYYVPTVYEMDPTLNGLLPETTRSQWCAFLDAKGIERSGLSPYEFGYYENDDDTITLTGIVGKVPAGALEIPAEVDGYNVSAIGEKFLEKTSGITSVTISEGVTAIGREAFHEIPTLTSVSLPSTLTNVGEKVFCDCPKLTKITVAEGNETVKVVNGVLCDFGQGLAVVGVKGITSLTLPAGITRIGKQAFCACTKLTTADLSAASVEEIAKNAFAGCTALTTVTFPSTLSYIDEEPFLMCSKLKTVNFLGVEPVVAGSFYSLDEAGTKFVPATTYVKTGSQWDAEIPGTWQKRPISYADPAVRVTVAEGSEDLGTVKGAGSYKYGKKATLKATAAKGNVFAGWYVDAACETLCEDYGDGRNPSLTVTVEGDVSLYAKFIAIKEDYCDTVTIGGADVLSGVPNGKVEVRSASLPTITVSGLPKGVTYDKKTGEIVSDETKMKTGSYAFVVSAKNAGGYKIDRVFTFDYDFPEDVPDYWENEYAVGQIVDEDLSLSFYAGTCKDTLRLSGLPTGLKLVTTYRLGEDGNKWPVYSLQGVPTKAGRYTVTCTPTYYYEYNGKFIKYSTTVKYYGVVQGAPSRYVEVVAEAGSPDGCKVTGSGVYAAGATVKTSATAAKDYVFAGWYAEDEGEETMPYGNVYADFLGKDGDYRVASQSWLCGTQGEQDTVPDVLVARFISKADDAMPEDAIVIADDEESVIEEGKAWTIADGEKSGVSVTVDSPSAPKLTVRGSVAGITVKNYGTWATLAYDPAGKSQPKPGEYALTLTAQNQSKDSATRTLAVRVPNEQDPEGVIWPDYGFDGAFTKDDYSAYTVGEVVGLDDVAVFGEKPEEFESRTISVSGLPAGVKYKDGRFSGIPTKAGCFTVNVTVKFKRYGDTAWSTTKATVFFRVEAIDTTCVGTFNGAVYDADTNAVGTISATVSAAGKLTSCKIVDLKGKSTSITLKTQTFAATEGYYEIVGADRSGVEYSFEIYPTIAEEGAEAVALGGTMYAYVSDGREAQAQQNVWSDKTYKAEGLLPNFPSKGVADDYKEDGLSLVFKAAGAVTVKRGKKSGSARFELVSYDEDEGWTGVMTVNVPDGSAAGYCKTFDVTVSPDSADVKIAPVKEGEDE